MERFIEKLKKGEREAAKINEKVSHVTGINVAVGLLSVCSRAIQAAFYMRLASEGGHVKSSFLVPPEALEISRQMDCDQLRIIAVMRGIELDTNE